MSAAAAAKTARAVTGGSSLSSACAGAASNIVGSGGGFKYREAVHTTQQAQKRPAPQPTSPLQSSQPAPLRGLQSRPLNAPRLGSLGWLGNKAARLGALNDRLELDSLLGRMSDKKRI
ncbi:hypothetical protein FOA52_012091 [Chlamydomonas sp. UWO 241]|nr:hypothetical protein FOA52_012091 [Chlamydomonas sp. UWO 241]